MMQNLDVSRETGSEGRKLRNDDMKNKAADALEWRGHVLWYGGLYVGCVLHMTIPPSQYWRAWAMVEEDGEEVARCDTREKAMRFVEQAVMAALPPVK